MDVWAGMGEVEWILESLRCEKQGRTTWCWWNKQKLEEGKEKET